MIDETLPQWGKFDRRAYFADAVQRPGNMAKHA
jgi:hypothetical protein